MVEEVLGQDTSSLVVLRPHSICDHLFRQLLKRGSALWGWGTYLIEHIQWLACAWRGPSIQKFMAKTGTKRHIFPQIVSLLPDLNLPPRGSIKAKGSNSDQFFIDCLMLTLVSQCSENTIKFLIKLWEVNTSRAKLPNLCKEWSHSYFENSIIRPSP